MTHVLRGVLTAQALSDLRSMIGRETFDDGLATNPGGGRIKRNLQLYGTPAAAEIGKLLQEALYKHPVFGPLVLPKRASLPYVARYLPGMYYQRHVDEPVLRGSMTLRTDLSCTVFLADPGDYEGGELEIEQPGGITSVKLPAGDAFIYASNSIHQVKEVTSGERTVALCWFESLVREAQRRAVLHELDDIVASLMSSQADRDIALKTAAVRSDLLRLWADT